MTDIYISCASEDAGAIKPVVDALDAEGWRVWFEPESSPGQRERAIDAELGAAGAVVVLWSDASRDSEYVRTEAATGLYRNKLIQISFNGSIAPRPFDQLETFDLSSWDGDTSDATWQRLVGAVKLFAGAPGSDRPQVVRNSAAGFASQAASRPGRPQFGVHSDIPHDRLDEKPVSAAWGDESEAHGANDSRPVFDSAIDDAPPPAAATMDRSLGVPADDSGATVTPGAASGSPITAAVSEMERRMSSVATDWPPRESEEAAVADAPVADHDDFFARHRSDEPDPWQPREASGRADFGGDEPEYARRDYDAPRYDERPAEASDEFFTRHTPPGGRPPSYGEQRSSSGVGPVAVVGLLAVVGGGLWFVDPMGWRQGGEKSAYAASPAAGPAAPAPAQSRSILAASGPLYDDPVAENAWESVDRNDPEELRTFIIVHRDSTTAETARALLKVLDAQAWANAVTSDIEAGYEDYLENFPAPTGEMTRAAASRIVALGDERRQAIASIQAQLRELDLYEGTGGGTADPGTQSAVEAFAERHDLTAPKLVTAAPRDLRRFADRVLEEVRATVDAEGAEPEMSVSALAVLAEAQPAPAAVRPQPEPQPQPEPETAEQPEVEAGEETEVAELAEDTEAEAQAERLAAWEAASQAGTVDGYAVFIRDYPDSPRAESARAAIQQLSRPDAFSLDWLSGDTREAVDAARAAQGRARVRANEARAVAAEADAIAEQARAGSEFARTVVAPDGDVYETQTSNLQPNGLGVRTSGDAESNGDRYRGRISNGLAQGLGVYDFADNPNNAAAQALRYAGENASDSTNGYGVMEWRNGNRFEGQTGGALDVGVLLFANGQRYEGQMQNGNRHGYGVFWSADGDVMVAGRWENGDLVQPMQPFAGPDIQALVASVTSNVPVSGPAAAEQDERVEAPAAAPSATPRRARSAPATIEAGRPLRRSDSEADASEADEQTRKWLRSGFGGGRRPDRF